MSKLDYYTNPTILSAIEVHIRHIRSIEDKEDCRQEIFANLYDFMPLDVDEAINLIDRAAMKFRRNYIQANKIEYQYTDRDYISLGDGNFQRKAHFGTAD